VRLSGATNNLLAPGDKAVSSGSAGNTPTRPAMLLDEAPDTALTVGRGFFFGGPTSGPLIRYLHTSSVQKMLIQSNITSLS